MIKYNNLLNIHSVLFVNKANKSNMGLLPVCRVQLIFCKNNANEGKGNLFPVCRVQLIFCKITFFIRQ
ncbi:hypothetical protein ADJ77_09260 [Prevotella fusca JCM 17724]|uniref:Uncharacterized protein n=1 Tax=Prevotella fusca JCM 17724 TaxID=1236517 RepID=A0A0K1NMX8_9BACT|nr:hypothetical protein ADJ77_09260 [Prevotella fusca JCM 17724]